MPLAMTLVKNKPRVELIDFSRGLALIAMTLFHFGWDVEILGIVEAGFASQPAMVWFARCIASAFLFLVGVGLVLANANGFKKRSYFLRLAKVIAAAVLITIATYFATPAFYIFFGILHHIAVASIIGLVFLKLPHWLNFIAGLVVLATGVWVQTNLFGNPIWSWTGLSTHIPKSSDFVPVFPFFAAVLFGIATAQLAMANNWIPSISKYKLNFSFGRAMKFIGRNSLVYYLIHQPIMIGILALILYLS